MTAMRIDPRAGAGVPRKADPHAVVRLRIGAAVPHWVGDVQLELEEKGGWLVAVDSAGPAQVVFRQASAEITLRVAPGLHVLHFIQYRQAEYPEQGRLPVGSQVDLSAIFEEGGEYAVQLAASKLHRLNCA